MGLRPDRTEREVRRQYKNWKKNYNPDNFADPGQKKHARQAMEEIKDAYINILNSYRDSGYSSYTSSQQYQQQTFAESEYTRENYGKNTATGRISRNFTTA